jgi:hypothetical protein
MILSFTTMLTSLVTVERAARTGNAEMFDDLFFYGGIKRTFLRSLGAKLLFGNSAKIIVPRSWLSDRVPSLGIYLKTSWVEAKSK